MRGIVVDLLKFGFIDLVIIVCCGVGKYNGIDGVCCIIGNFCVDRLKFVFWDVFYFIEKVNRICNEKFFYGGIDVISFMNLVILLVM